MRTTEEKALCTIIHAEESRSIYKSIKEVIGKSQPPLTQVDILSTPDDPTSGHTNLTSKSEVEHHILQQNRCDFLHSFSTPFFSHHGLWNAIDPLSNTNSCDDILQGTLLDDISLETTLSDHEKLWIASLHQIVTLEISLALSCDDYKHFLHAKREGTSSSPLGHHFGHYISLLECLWWNEPMVSRLIINITFISLTTALPLHHWQTILLIIYR